MITCDRRNLSVILTLTLSFVLLLSVTACHTTEESGLSDSESVTLRVLTNVQSVSALNNSNDKYYSMYDELTRLVAEYEADHENVTIEIEVLPVDTEEREVRAQQLRTEIMAGDGPDIYLMGDWVEYVEREGSTYRLTYIQADDMIFSDVTQAMYNGLFYDISTYYNADSELESDALAGGVMDAGMIGGGRFVLPLRYDFAVAYADAESLSVSGLDVEAMRGSINGYLNELLRLGDWRWAHNAQQISYRYPFFAFTNLIDYERQTVTLSAEIVANYMRMVQSTSLLGIGFYESALEQLGEDVPLIAGTLSKASRAYTGAAQVEAIPLRSIDGDLIANVQSWCAVGASCENPSVAYDFIRGFLTEESQWEENYLSGEYRGNGYIPGCPVRPAEAENEALRKLYNTPVDIARFTTRLEFDFEYNKLQRMFNVSRIDSVPEEITLPDGFEDKYVCTASDMDIDAVANTLVEELRWGVAER